jgi:hypothetical protein
MKAATVHLAMPNSTQRIIEEISALLPPVPETAPAPAVVA